MALNAAAEDRTLINRRFGTAGLKAVTDLVGFIPEGFDFFIEAVTRPGAGRKDHPFGLNQQLRTIAAGHNRTGAFNSYQLGFSHYGYVVFF